MLRTSDMAFQIATADAEALVRGILTVSSFFFFFFIMHENADRISNFYA